MKHWLMKSEPAKYSWNDLVADGETVWDGVRNHRAANNLRAMEDGDLAFYYHSVVGKEIVGIVEVSEASIGDPTDPEGKWPAVRIRPVSRLARPVTLKEIKGEETLGEIELVRLSRLSVAGISSKEWQQICSMSEG